MNLKLSYSVLGQAQETIDLSDQRMLIGTLLSNQIVLRAPDVEPIHALIESEDDQVVITDLGSGNGVLLNGRHIHVESRLSPGDELQIGIVVIKVLAADEGDNESTVIAAPLLVPPRVALAPKPNSHAYVAHDQADHVEQLEPADPGESAVDDSVHRATQRRSESEENKREKRDMLFSPRKARPSGDVLECVAYWGDTVIDVELFHPTFRGFEKVEIGDRPACHLPAGGEGELLSHILAEPRSDGFSVKLLEGMTARIRRSGQVESSEGKGNLTLGRRDIVHIKFGAIRYFLLYVKPPVLDLPRQGGRDTLFFGFSTFALLFYLALIPFVLLSERPEKIDFADDDIVVINRPELEKPKPVQVTPPKPEVKVAEVEVPPKKPPMPEPPKKIAVVKPTEPQKPPQPKPDVPQKPAEKPIQSLAQPKPEAAKPAADLNKLAEASKGMASINSTKPDFKAAHAPEKNKKTGPANGDRGAGKPNPGSGARKGNTANSRAGVEGPKNDKPSGVNLSKLGLAGARVIDQVGPGAVKVDFKDSPGGGGGGAGSASRTVGLGGSGSRSSLDVSGSGGAQGFGQGGGGFLGGNNGAGGLDKLGASGQGSGGRGRPVVTVPLGDPGITGGLSSSEVMDVIKARLNEIRHCYNQLLQRKPNSAGKITVFFEIGTNGRVTTANIKESSIPDSTMQGCVTGAVRRWPFPKPRGGEPVKVTYPFVLTNK